jgi:hypothetical protein
LKIPDFRAAVAEADYDWTFTRRLGEIHRAC